MRRACSSVTLTSTTMVVRPRCTTRASAVSVPRLVLRSKLTDSCSVSGKSSGCQLSVGLVSHMAAAVAVSSARAMMAPA